MAFRFAFINPPSGGSDDMKKANVTSQINGERTSFTVPENYQSGSLRVYYNGVRQVVGEHFSEVNENTFNCNFTPQSGDFLTVDYIRSS
jgi:hypothetical protein